MNIKHIAAAAITPAAIAGIVLSTGAAANAATVHHSARGKAHVWVTVRAGDTLSGIAAAHHMSWQALWTASPNRSHISDPNLIMVGEHLRIPADPSRWAALFVAPQPQPQPQPVTPAVQPAAQAPAQSAPAQAPAQSAPAQAPSPQPAAQAPVQSSSPAQSSSGAGESSFEQCVSWRESGNDPTDPDGLFGILPSVWASLGHSGTAGQASVSEQKAAFNTLFAEDGTRPWAPSDGC